MSDEDKNGHRRRSSSILKQPKSPRQALQELENNEKKEKENMKSKLERRSSRRVSFADTCQVQEFCKEISSYVSSSENHCPEMEICRGFAASAAPPTIQQTLPLSTLPSNHSLLTGPILYLPLSVADSSKECEIVSRTAVAPNNGKGAQAGTDRIPLKVLNPDDLKNNNAANSEEFPPVEDVGKVELNRTIYMNEGNNSMEITCADAERSEPRLSVGNELKERQRTVYFDNQHDEMEMTTANSFSLYMHERDASITSNNLPTKSNQVFLPNQQTASLPSDNASTRGDHEPICRSETNMAVAHVDANFSSGVQSARFDPAPCDVEIQQSASSVSANFETNSMPAVDTHAAARGREDKDEDMEFTEVENFSIIVTQEDFKVDNLQDDMPIFEKSQTRDALNVFLAPGSEDCTNRDVLEDRVPDLQVAGDVDVNMDFSNMSDSIVSGSSANLLPVCSTARDDLNPASFFKNAMQVSFDEIRDPLDDSVFHCSDDSMEILEQETIPKCREETPTNIFVKSTVVTNLSEIGNQGPVAICIQPSQVESASVTNPSLPDAATGKDDVARIAVGATIIFDDVSGNMELTSCATRSRFTRTPTIPQQNFKTVMFDGTSADMDVSMDCSPTDMLLKTREERRASTEILHVVSEIVSMPQAVTSPRHCEPPFCPDLKPQPHSNDDKSECGNIGMQAAEIGYDELGNPLICNLVPAFKEPVAEISLAEISSAPPFPQPKTPEISKVLDEHGTNNAVSFVDSKCFPTCKDTENHAQLTAEQSVSEDSITSLRTSDSIRKENAIQNLILNDKGCSVATAAQNDNLMKSPSSSNLLVDGQNYSVNAISCLVAPAPQNEASLKSLYTSSLISTESVRKSTDNLNSVLEGENIIVPDSSAVEKEITEMSKSFSLSKAEARVMLDAPAEPSLNNDIAFAVALPDHIAQISVLQAEDKSVIEINVCECSSDEPKKLSNSPRTNETLPPESIEWLRRELGSNSNVENQDPSAIMKVASSSDMVSDDFGLSTNVKNSDESSTEKGKLQAEKTDPGDDAIAEVHNSLENCSAKVAGTKKSGAVSTVKVKVRQQKRPATLIEQPDAIPRKQALIEAESCMTEADSIPRTSKPTRSVAMMNILESSTRRAVVRYGFSQEATLDETQCPSTSVALDDLKKDEDPDGSAAAVIKKNQNAMSEGSVRLALGDDSLENIMEISCPTLVSLTETVSFCAADEKEYCIGDECNMNIEEAVNQPIVKPEEAGKSKVKKTAENGDNPALGGFSGAMADASILNSARRPHRPLPLHGRLQHMLDTASSVAKCGTKRGDPKAESGAAWLDNKRNESKAVAESTAMAQTSPSNSLAQKKLAEIADQKKHAAYQARMEIMLRKMSDKNVQPSKCTKQAADRSQEANEVIGRKTSPHNFLEHLETAKQLLISHSEVRLKALADHRRKVESYNSKNYPLQADMLLKSAGDLKGKVDQLRDEVNNLEIVKYTDLLKSPEKEKTRRNPNRNYNVEEWTSKCIHISFWQNVLHLKFCLGDVIAMDESVEEDENREILTIQKWSTLKDDADRFSKLAHRCMWDALSRENIETTCKNTRRLQQILPTLIMYSEDAMTLYLDVKRIGFGHVIDIRDSLVVMVEFNDIDAFLNFQLEFVIEPGAYPNRRLQPELKVIIGQIRNEDLQTILRTVNLGPSYLFRLVDAIDKWLKSCCLPKS